MECPVCKGPASCEYVDIGVGSQQCTPYVCENPECGWVQPDPDEEGYLKYLESLDDRPF